MLESHRAVDREPEAGVITAWLAAACTCAGRSTTGSFAGYMTDIITNATPRVVKKFNYRIIWADGGSKKLTKGPARSSVLRTIVTGQMLATNSWAILSRSIPVA